VILGLTLIEDQMSFYNVRRSGSSYNSATIIAAISDLGDTECVAYLSKGLTDTQTVWTIDQSFEVPENITVLIPCGVIVNVLAGMFISFFGPVLNQCPLWKTGPGVVNLLSKTAINSQSYSNFFDPFVVSGGLHGLSPTAFSPNFHTEAYLSNGQYILEPVTSIDYGAMGATNHAWVILSDLSIPNIPGTNFINVPGTHYYIDIVSVARPALPENGVSLMEVEITGGTITRVNDLRALDAAQGLLNRIPFIAWTPSLSPGNYVYAAQSGHYYNMGKLVYVAGYIAVTSITAYGSGPLKVINLPYNYAMDITSFGGITFHRTGRIKPLYGPSSFSGSVEQRELLIVENVVGHPVIYVTADRAMPNMELHFTGTYILA